MTTQDPGPRERLRSRIRHHRAWADEDPPTLIGAPPPLVLWDVRQPLPAPVDREQQESFDFVQRIGAIMLARGASVDDVEAAVRAAALAMGLPSPAVDVTFTSIIVSVRPDPSLPPLTSVGVVHQRSDEYSQLAATHQLLLALTAGKLSREKAFERLSHIEEQRHPYGRNAVTLARGVLAGAIVAQLGGSWSACLVVTAVAMLIDISGRWLTRHRVPTFYLNVVGGLLATLAAASTTALGAQDTPSLIVAGSIVALLPGGTLVNGVRDALSGYFVTGVARVFEVLVLVGGLVGGVAIGLQVSQAFAADMSVIPGGGGLEGLPVRIVFAAVAAAAIAVVYQTPVRLFPAIALSAALGLLVLGLVEEAGVAGVGAYSLAAFAVGLSAYVFTNVQRALPMMVVVPGILPLLPGLTIYTGLLELSTDEVFGGIVSLVEAGARGLTIAAAVLIAELIEQPVRRRMTRQR